MKKLATLILSFGLLACGSIKVREKNIEATNRVKRVAIVGFSLQQPAPRKLGLDLSKGGLTGTAGGSQFAENSQHAEKFYSELQKHLQKNFGWEVIKLSDLKTHPGYKKAFDMTMTGWQNKMPTPENMRHHTVEGVMDADGTRILGPTGRDELVKSLKVDAIMNVRFNVELHGTKVMGIGSSYPQSHLGFELYAAGLERAIWFDGDVEGSQSGKSVGKTAFFDEALLNELSLESALGAMEKLQPNLN